MPSRAEQREATRAAIADAALERFTTRGYAAVTLAEIAAAAGIGTRTLYRHVSDKEELLFGEDAAWQAALAAALAARPADEGPATAVLRATQALAGLVEPRRGEMRRRASVITATPELRARELVKHAGWVTVVVDGLLERGVPAARARLLARVAVACVGEALERWLAGGERPRRGLARELVRTWDELGEVLPG